MQTSPASISRTRQGLLAAFRDVRAHTEMLAAPLVAEDTVVQPMEDASPPKWHLAHSSWFFEHFCLGEFEAGYTPYHEGYAFLFNSYYDSIGSRTPRPLRGFMTRPTLGEVMAYRHAVNERMAVLIEQAHETVWARLSERVELGLQHEQQHQELLVTDLKYTLSLNPLDIVYQPIEGFELGVEGTVKPLNWLDVEEGVYEIGYRGEGFHFDNESPSHKVYLHGFQVADRLVTNGEFMNFMLAGGYENPIYWLSEGWSHKNTGAWRAPLYWFEQDGIWHEYTLHGVRPVPMDVPVTHISYFEADAYAEWAGFRLLTEAEWEVAASEYTSSERADDILSKALLLHPSSTTKAGDPYQFFEAGWQWTKSAYLPYPGYRRTPDALGEYNGKWMINQMVLRGSSPATPAGHSRQTYRNFFHPDKRWQFTAIRLAR
jgi:ergothioneine biosynthesis protein EgtB